MYDTFQRNLSNISDALRGFGTICVIQKTWKAPTEEWYFQVEACNLLKITLRHGCFHDFEIVQMVLNCAKRDDGSKQYWFFAIV